MAASASKKEPVDVFRDKERAMRKLILILSLAVLLPAASSWGQLAAPNEAGVTMGHLHLLAQDIDAGEKFWIALGATPVKFGPGEAMKLPGVLILLRKEDPSGGTVGSIVNHVGFRVPNVQAAMAKWKAAGLKTEDGRNPQQGFVMTPDNLVRIEILEDPSQSVPIAFHHIHFFVAEAGPAAGSVGEVQSWYAKMFGAKPGKRGPDDADDLPGVNLTFRKSDTPTVGTKGRALDHIGFEVKNLEGFCKKAESSGVKFDRPYTKRPELGISLAYLTDPWGTYIELTEGLNAL
jgi:catechol 2,3-dioxygenase-like lactoylglutathione lyase family enzyme